MAVRPTLRKTLRNWNWKRRKPRRKRCSTPKRAELARSMPGRRFALRRERLVTHSGRRARGPVTTDVAEDVAAVVVAAFHVATRRREVRRFGTCLKKAQEN